MLKYTDAQVTFAEIPDEITLCINLSNCPCHCRGCHSSYLAEDIGQVLTISRIEKLLKRHKGVTSICFMGGDNDPGLVNHYAHLIKKTRVGYIAKELCLSKDTTLAKKGIHLKKEDPIEVADYRNPIKVGWYSGRQELSDKIDLCNFDFIKLGPYNEKYGPLNKITTNQRFYEVFHSSNGMSKLIDRTFKFWKHETED